MNIDEIKALMKSGDVAGAESAAQKLLAAEPENVQAMMLYGTCRQLRGDEATFRQLHDELASKMSMVADIETRGMWRMYERIAQKIKVEARVLPIHGRLRPGFAAVYGCPNYGLRMGCGCSVVIGAVALIALILKKIL